ncbi:MAG: hypothetical protein ACI8RD_007912, partial [Bacillariaceae sp.]|jgi:hypothetical protein
VNLYLLLPSGLRIVNSYFSCFFDGVTKSTLYRNEYLVMMRKRKKCTDFFVIDFVLCRFGFFVLFLFSGCEHACIMYGTGFDSQKV